MSLGERIRLIRKSLTQKMTQKDFGEKIGVSMAVITSYELNKAIPPEPTLRLICREFNVSYAWLKTGEGPMMVPEEYLQKAKVDNIIDGDNEFVKQVFYGLAGMSEDWWDQAEEMLRNALGIKKDR